MLLILATCAVYGQVSHFNFVNFDDPEYVSGNNHVRAGLTMEGLVWAVTSTQAANWFPLTWLSHMAAYQVFGLTAGGHHLVNVLFHVLASVLLLAAFQQMTGAFWRSALVAFLFALHPLHVESVAWVAERKDVLCAFFWFLTLWCYARYAAQPSRIRYGLVILAFCGGLMSKSMIVTLPFVLLLLDYWPLRRPRRLALLWEKLPLFALAGGVSALTYLSQQKGNAVRSLSTLPLSERIANALSTYLVYIVRMLWPARLAVYYPYRHDLPAWHVAAAGVVLAAITAAMWQWTDHGISLFFFPAVVISAIYGGYGSAAVATVLAVASQAYFFVAPYNSFNIGFDDAVPTRTLRKGIRYICRGVIAISSAAVRAVNLSLSSRARTSRRFSSRLLITTMPIEMTASELPKRSRN